MTPDDKRQSLSLTAEEFAECCDMHERMILAHIKMERSTVNADDLFDDSGCEFRAMFDIALAGLVERQRVGQVGDRYFPIAWLPPKGNST